MKYLFLLITITVAAFALACGSGGGPAAAGKTIKSGPAGNNLTVTIASPDGTLRKGKQDLTLTFADSSGKPVDVGSASLNFFMPAMGSMAAMNNPATLTTTSTPGVYSAKVDLEMSGEWQAQIKYDGPAGKGNPTFPMTAQ
jgi:hypothetical protein